MTISEFFHTSSVSTIFAPADSYSASEKWDDIPAPFSIRTLKPGWTNLETDYRNVNDLKRKHWCGQCQLCMYFVYSKCTWHDIHDFVHTSGVAATRFSKGKRSFGTPTVNFEYGIPFGFSSLAVEEKCRVAEEADLCPNDLVRLLLQRSPSDMTLPGLMEASRIIMSA